MNLPRCTLSLESSTLADWRAWAQTLTSIELADVQAKMSAYLLKGEAGFYVHIMEIRGAIRDTMVARFPTLAAQVDFLSIELGKAKAMNRLEVPQRKAQFQ